jgi:hypothetical protein
VTQPTTPSFNVLVKCTKSVDCSASIASDLTYFLTEMITLSIPACLITPSICKNLTTGSLSTNNVTINNNLATLMKNNDGTFSVEVLLSDSRFIN